MTAFGPDQADTVLAQCQSASGRIGDAFAAAFGGAYQARTRQPVQLDMDALPANLASAGLVFRIALEETQCLAVLSQADGLLPDWCAEPDPDEAQKLQQLGSDLAAAMLPSGSDPKLAGVTFIDDLAAVVRDAQPTDESVCLPLEMAQDDVVVHLLLIWPVADSAGAAGSMAEPDAASSGTEPSAPGQLPKHRRLIYRNLEDGIRQLPAYAQSLLRVPVPVTVTLAATKTPVSKVLDMGPGTILQFKKSCDSNLTLEVGHQTVAEGEAVKVGDKFGLWITSMTMPGERFWSVSKTASRRVK